MKLTELERKEKGQEIIEILKQHNIKISIEGCGCCGSPWVSFEYNGNLILDNVDDININMFNRESKIF